LEQEYLFLSFAPALRDGEFHGGQQIMSSTISDILYQVSIIMVKYQSHHTCKTNPGQYSLDKSFRDLYKGYKDEDTAL